MNLSELKKLAEAATPGPWIIKDDCVQTDYIEKNIDRSSVTMWHPPTMKYIAATSPDVVLKLITALETAKSALEFYAQDLSIEKIYNAFKEIPHQNKAQEALREIGEI